MGVKTVWVLGAGFGRSLGGPLLDDLLSPGMTNLVQALYGDNKFVGVTGSGDESARLAARAVRRLYTDHGSVTAGSRLWLDAEAMLDQLDAAGRVALGPSAKRIRSTLDQLAPLFKDVPLTDVRDAARRLVAAACCAFLKRADTSEERWDPYREWAQTMAPSDAIVTFNYDRVVETVGDSFEVVMPGEPPGPTVTRVYKLHGSVDWRRERFGQEFRWHRERDTEFALNCKGDEIGIATPGPSKRLSAGELKDVWDGALERLGEANVIVFVGYRFPPSDAEARKRLLLAIQKNAAKHLELHVVLGPDRTMPDVVRLDQLLRYSVGRASRLDYESTYGSDLSFDPAEVPGTSFQLTTHALFAEDFLTVWDRKLLWPFKDPVEPA